MSDTNYEDRRAEERRAAGIGRVGGVEDGDLRARAIRDVESRDEFKLALAGLRHTIDAFRGEARAERAAIDAYRAEVAAWRQETAARFERLDKELQDLAMRRRDPGV